MSGLGIVKSDGAIAVQGMEKGLVMRGGYEGTTTWCRESVSGRTKKRS